MKRRISLIFILSIFVTIGIAATSYASLEQRIALVIGNSAYSTGPLSNPVNDASDMASSLKNLGFEVTLHTNSNRRIMEEAILDFGSKLTRVNGVGLFYYAGHGMQIGGVNYLIPVGARVEKETDVQFEAVNVERVLAEMANAKNGINIVLLDACRDNPFSRSFRSASRGLAIVSNAPSGTFISYSTGANQIARDGEGRNSPYTAALLEYIKEPELTIGDVFMKVRQRLRQETGQVPWELSSLEGRFFFVPRKTSKPEVAAAPSVELDAQKREIEAERERLRKEKELLDQKEALAKEKEELAARERKLSLAGQSSVSEQKIEELDKKFKELELVEREFKAAGGKFPPHVREEMLIKLDFWRKDLEEQKRQIASIEKRPSPTSANETGRDGRFIAYDNGTVLNTFGMTLQEITPEVSKHLRLTTNEGIIVVAVRKGSVADEAGIQLQDVILEVNQVKIATLNDYIREIDKSSVKTILFLLNRKDSNFFVALRK